MKSMKVLSPIIMLFLVILSFTLSTGLADNNNTSSINGNALTYATGFLTNYETTFKNIDNQPIVAYAKVQGSHNFLAVDQALVILNYLELANEAQNSQLISLRNSYISDSLATIKFMNTYLVNSLTREKEGIIEYWDTNLQDLSLTRVSKLARDQALTLLALDKLFTFIDNGYNIDNTTYTLLKEDFSNIWKFLTSLYDQTNGGWFTKTTAINQTAISLDTSKRTADNLIIISSLEQIKHVSFLESNFTIDQLKAIEIKSINFFLTKFVTVIGGISSFGSADGSMISNDTFFAQDNSLFGLALVNLYQVYGNESYLSEAENIWSYIKQNFWDIGPGGLFIGVNSMGDPVISGKAIEDQIFFAQLSLKLASIVPINSDYLAYYLKLSTLINYNYIKNNLVASSTDLRFNPSSEYYVQSASYYIDFLVNSPHISTITYSNSIIIGSKLPVQIFMVNYNNVPMNISISADNYFDPTYVISNSSSVAKDLEFTTDIQSGLRNIYIEISISNAVIQKFTLSVNFTPNVRIPNGLLYLIGAGILAGIVVLVRRPPEFLKKYIQELKKEQSSTPVNDPETRSN